ncbi:MAG: hypothetical protein ABJK28_06765 [Algibacter sp.]
MSVKRLINRGLFVVYLPLVLLVVFVVTVTHWLAENNFDSNVSQIIAAISLMIAILIGWFWWSYKIVKWKYWAFSQLNFEESIKLYTKAIETGLIWPTGSVFNKTEFWSKKDKEKWDNLSDDIKSIFEID